MGPVELILLGRTLMKIGEQALPSAGGGERTVVIVMSDVYEHERTTVGEVAATDITPALAAALDNHELAEVLAALEVLGRRLTPQTLTRR